LSGFCRHPLLSELSRRTRPIVQQKTRR
jgi:hypothetical protein